MSMFDFATVHIVKATGNWIGKTGVGILLILAGAWLIRVLLTRIVRSFMKRAVRIEQTFMVDLDRQKRVETFTNLINAILTVLIWTIGGILILQKLGVQTAPLLTGAGVLGVGLAFGTQSLIKDFVSGLFIVMENQYRVGDEVELDSTKGTVEHVGIRTTVLRDEEGNVHFVPNGIIQRTTNRSMGYTPLRFVLTIDARTSLPEIEEIIDRMGDKMASEKKWRPQFLAPLHYAQMGQVEGKRHDLLIVGKAKNAYKKDIAKEFRARLLDKLERKNVKVISMKEPPAEVSTDKK